MQSPWTAFYGETYVRLRIDLETISVAQAHRVSELYCCTPSRSEILHF